MTVEQIHQTAEERAKRFVESGVSFLEILEVVERERVHLHKGYASLWSYCTVGLKLSESDAHRFISVMRKAKAIPELKKAVMEGALSLPKASRIAPLLTTENKTEWIEKAIHLTSRNLEVAVVRENPKPVPQERVTPRAEDVFELKTKVNQSILTRLAQVKNLLSQKLRRAATTEEVLDFALEEVLERHDPLRKAARNQGKSLSALKVIPKGRIKQPSATRHTVILRDGRRCTQNLPNGARCEEERHLEMHHEVLVSEGGSNEAGNQRLLCGGHHRAWHLQRGAKSDQMLKG